jgi:putative membrane protein
MRLLTYLLINAFAVFIAGYILPGVRVDSFLTALIVAVVLGVINTFFKPILLFLTLPITVITLGFFYFVLNAVIVSLTSYIVPGFHVANLWWALLFSLVISLVSWFLHSLAD